MVVAIHQPNYLPYLGFFEKFVKSDIFVVLDHVQFTKNGFQNRNLINTWNGVTWLTVPVKNKIGTKTDEIIIDNSKKWEKQHFSTISQSYSRAKHYSDGIELIYSIYSKKWERLIDLNMELLSIAFQLLDPQKKTIFSSQLALNSSGSDLILDICLKTGATEYLSGKSGKNYLNLQDFINNDVFVKFQQFEHPVYEQCHGNFISNLAFIDHILNCGIESFQQLFSRDV